MKKRITLTIDGLEVEAEEGATVLQAAQGAGLYIPTLCAHPYLTPFGACRLCVVEVEKMRGLPTSCTLPAAQGMVVHTDTPEVNSLRKSILELILSEHPHACLTCHKLKLCSPYDICLRNVAVTERCVTCPKNKRCELQEVALYIGIDEVALDYQYRGLPLETDSPFFDRDYNLCILCGRCVRVCGEVRGIYAIAFVNRGSQTLPGTAFSRPLKDAGCKFCYACVEVCPTAALMDKAYRFGNEVDREAHVVPCRHACPAHIDVPRYLYYIAQGRYAEALAINREKVPFPGVLGRVCFHPCEDACRRGQLNEPISIKALKRFAHERDTGLWRENSRVSPPTGKKVAIVGSGPAGLTAAYYLAKLGHAVTVLEALPQPGGMMRVGIPEYRLPRQVLDEEVEIIKGAGVDIKVNTRIDSLDDLFRQGYHAALVAVGAHQGMKMGVPGEDAPGILECVTFLREVNLGEKVKIGDRVGVVGGGNAAIDAARTSLRLGAKEVTIVYRRTRAEMPANPEEVEEALHEGVKILFLAAPNKITTEKKVVRMECLRMRLGEPDASGRRRPVPISGSEFTLDFDTLIAAIGQQPEVPTTFNLPLARGNTIRTTEDLATPRERVFACGDAITGPASVIEAIASARQAAVSIDKYLGGQGVIDEVLAPVEEPDPFMGRDEGFGDMTRSRMPCLALEQRKDGFAEVELGFTEGLAVAEARRCFRCDLRLTIPPVPAVPVRARGVEMTPVASR